MYLCSRFELDCMVHNIFKGLGIALITPFKEDGSVDYEALIRLVDYQLSNGADFFCILATTGETPVLTPAEKQKIKDTIVDYVQGRVPILMGCGGYNTAAVVEELKNGDFRGIDGILSVCPYYNKPSQEGLYQHFKAIAAATKLPVVLYNVPGRTGVNMLPETVFRLAAGYPHKIIGVKEASGKQEQIEAIIRGTRGSEFVVLSGDDGWQPSEMVRDCDKPIVGVMGKYLVWQPVKDAVGYVIIDKGEIVGFTNECRYKYSRKHDYQVFAVNKWGAMGKQ